MHLPRTYFSSLGITPPQKYPENLGELLWTVIVTDYMLKLITVIIKAVFTMLPQKTIPSSKRVNLLHVSFGLAYQSTNTSTDNLRFGVDTLIEE